MDEILADVCGEAEVRLEFLFCLEEATDEADFFDVSVRQLPRPQIVKKIWEHIKGNKLQDPSNGRKVLCDPKLKRLFGKDEVE